MRVVGTSGAGKSTLARRIAAVVDAPYVELDEVFWGPGWVKRDADEARAELRARLAAPAWVVDGNWETLGGDLYDGADTVVWLDYPRRVVMSRVVRRTLHRGLLRTELWHGNRESLRNLLRRDPHENIVLWAWTSHPRVRERWLERCTEPGAPVVRLTSPRATRRWLRELERQEGPTRPASPTVQASPTEP